MTIDSPAAATDHAPPEVPDPVAFDVTLKVRRFDPDVSDQHFWQEFTISVFPTDRILDCLHKIKWEQDGTLTFRRSCGHGICGSLPSTWE